MPHTIAARPLVVSSVPAGGIGVRGYYVTHFLGAVFPFVAGVLLYGWHALVAVAAVIGSTALGIAFWRRIGPRGRMLRYTHGLWFAMLLALMLPAHLAAGVASGPQVWPILPLAGLVLAIFLWLFGGMGSGHIHPVVATYLLLVICFGSALLPHRILNFRHMGTGDLYRSGPTDARDLHNEAWIGRRNSQFDSDYQEPTAERLSRYTSGREELKSRDRMDLPGGAAANSMAPLEDFAFAGQPGPIGISSVIAIVFGGLFLLYRGMIDYRIPLLTCVVAYIALLILPVPALIDNGPQWRWAIFRGSADGWSVAITFVNYEMMASPLIFTAFFLATAASINPMTRRGTWIFAITLGVVCAVFQLYVSVSYGPYLALLLISLLTPELDRIFKVRPLA